MKRLIGILTLFVATFAVAQEAPPKAGVYYPLKKDAKWTYASSQGPIEVKVISEDKGVFKLETTINGKMAASESIQVKDDGYYRTTINGTKADVPVKFLKLPPAKGDTWDFEFKVQGQTVKGKYVVKQESVKVPAGEYKEAFLVDTQDTTIGNEKATLKTWFAPDVGIVKIQFSLAGQEADLKLEKYEPGK